MTLQGLRHGFVFKEIKSFYKERPEGSKSKLSTYKDGMKIFLIIISIFMNYNPLKFFGIISGLLLLLSIATGSVVVYEYIKYSYIYRVPTAILSVGAMLMSALGFILGILLDSIGKKTKDLEYLVSMKR